MKAFVILAVLLIIPALMAIGQRTSIELTFTADNNGTHIQLDSIKIMNRTQGSDTLLYYPDTMLLALYYAGIPDMNTMESGFQVFRNYPNPVMDQTTISLFIPEKDRVTVSITDIAGSLLYTTDRMLDQGIHSFLFTPAGDGLYFFTARWKQMSQSIKIIGSPLNENRVCSLECAGMEESFTPYKTTADIKGFSYSIGDILLCIGYTDNLESGMLDTPEESQTYTFQFATNIPCPETPTVEYEGQVYNTIQIFSQCWLRDNLNVGIMIPGIMGQSDNETIEKYCYIDDANNCNIYGGLYQWFEMMQYTIQQGIRGICPPGWHLPTDEEWKVLEGAVDSQFGIGDNTWENGMYRGYDAGTNLKTTTGWYANGNGTDLFGFSGLPGGIRDFDGYFGNVGDRGYWWTSTEGVNFYAWQRLLSYYYPEVYRDGNFEEDGYSVRCLRDN